MQIDAKMAQNAIVLVLILSATIHFAFGYRWQVIDNEMNTVVCNNQICDERPHSSCLVQQPIHTKNCEDLKLISLLTLTLDDITTLLHGHNGLRNRIAMTKDNPVSNMNLLYWDRNLQRMAEGWIKQCIIDTDSCDFMYENSLTVGQNIRYVVSEKRPSRWINKIVAQWFLEKNDGTHTDRRTNRTQIIWAETEFIGCAAAQLRAEATLILNNNTDLINANKNLHHRYVHGYMLACNYNPAANLPGHSMFKPGQPCTNCSDDRPGCSYIYQGLCGIDIPTSGSERLHLNAIIVIISIVIVYPINIFA